jgi:hypothetical protein
VPAPLHGVNTTLTFQVIQADNEHILPDSSEWTALDKSHDKSNNKPNDKSNNNSNDKSNNKSNNNPSITGELSYYFRHQ